MAALSSATRDVSISEDNLKSCVVSRTSSSSEDKGPDRRNAVELLILLVLIR